MSAPPARPAPATAQGALACARLACPIVLPILSGMLGGCSRAAAPSFEFFGAFFPAWMLCALAGLAGAGTARVILVTPRLLGVIPCQLAVCTAVGVLVAVSTWLLLFR